MRSYLAWVVAAAIVVSIDARAAGYSFDSDGVKISYLDEGRGEPVVLIHGFGGSAVWWTETQVLPALAKGYWVIAPDLRGHGNSDKPPDPTQYGEQMAADIIRLLDHLEVEQAHVVGYSMGAAIAGKLLVTHPDRLLSVTFGGAGPLFGPPGAFAASLDATAESLEQGKGIAPLVIYLTARGEPMPSPEQVAAINEQFLRGNDPTALAAVLRGNRRLEVTEEQLKPNKLPVCFVYGSREGELKEIITAAQQALPTAAVRVVENGDHFSTPARPEFLAAVLDFLRAHGAEAAGIRSQINGISLYYEELPGIRAPPLFVLGEEEQSIKRDHLALAVPDHPRCRSGLDSGCRSLPFPEAARRGEPVFPVVSEPALRCGNVDMGWAGEIGGVFSLCRYSYPLRSPLHL